MNSAIMSKYEAERLARRNAQRDKFRAYVAEWLELRAQASSPAHDDTEDAVADVRLGRQDELARLITTTPAVLPWMIFQKWEVLEHCLGDPDGSEWPDNRQVVMLAGIKADLLRFPPTEGAR